MMNWKGKPSANLSDYEVARIGYNNTVMGVLPFAEEVHNLVCALQSSNTLIEEQGSRIEELEQKLRTTSLEALAISDTNNEMTIRIAELEGAYDNMSSLCAKVSQGRADAKARLSEAVKVLEEAAMYLDGYPEYHDSGMGCGLEDRNITDRYEAMRHGWDSAMDRTYIEHVNPASEAIKAFITTLGGEKE